jgi:hypothetical protein
VKLLKERGYIQPRRTLYGLREQRRRRPADGAPVALKAHVVNDSTIMVHLQLQRDLVAAQRVETVGVMCGILQRAKVARPAVMFQQNFLIQIAQI